MSKDMLGIAVRQLVTLPESTLGIVCDYLAKLADPEWERAAKKFLRRESPWEENLFRINRSTPFNPVEFLGNGWSIWKGPADGDGLSGDEEQYERSLALTEVDLYKVQLVTCLKKDEAVIQGEEKLRRLKEAGHIRLDAKIFQTLWEHKDKIPENWKEKINGNTRYIFFDGTILRSPSGHRYVLCLYRDDGEWDWGCGWLGLGWYVFYPSAVLAS